MLVDSANLDETSGTVSTLDSSPMSVEGTPPGTAPGSYNPPGAAANSTKRKIGSTDGRESNLDSPSTSASAKKSKSKVEKTALTDIDFDDANTVLGEAYKASKGNQQVPTSNIDRTRFVVSNSTVKEMKLLWPKYSKAPPPGKKKQLVDALVSLVHKRRAAMVASEPHSFGAAKNR